MTDPIVVTPITSIPTSAEEALAAANAALAATRLAVETAAETSTTRAREAAQSAVDAQTSANASDESRVAAAQAEQDASASAQTASDHAGEARASAEGADRSAQTAETQAGAANGSAINAAGSAQTATARASAASTSAAAALASETNAAASASQSQQIAAGLSAGAYTLDGVDAQRVGAIICPPRGLYMQGGSLVTLASLVSVSSGPKWVMNAAGNYVLVPANTPAIDYLTGVAAMRIEGSGATNYFLNSENPAVNSQISSKVTATLSAANALFGAFAYTTITYTDVAQTNVMPFVCGSDAVIAAVAGDLFTMTFAARKKAGAPDPVVGIYPATSGWGVAADYAGSVIYGPATLAFDGVRYRINNLSETAWSIVRITYRAKQAENVQPTFYNAVQNALVGDWVQWGMLQFERGLGSSYIPTGASPVARAADIVSLNPTLTGLLNAANATVALRAGWIGNVSPAADASTVWTMFGSTTSGKYGRIYGHIASQAVTFAPQNGSGSKAATAPAVASDIAFCVAASQGAGVKLANHQGAAVVSTPAIDTWFASLFTSADTSIGWGDGKASWSPAANLLLRELVIWPAYGSDAAVVAQSRAYA